MKTIKILGTGCPNCNQMEKIVQAALTELDLDIKIEKVDDIQEIMTYNIMSTPALVIDNIIVIKGRVPSLAEVKDLLTSDVCCSDSDDSCCSSESQEGACCETSTEKESCCDPKSDCC
ncbi:MAG: TM0996/MTH895 family glutaredoxin-like protein [Flavobacteriales bacterium]|jgi:small redox-active disulfide protein 2|nr:TM0996/MTH895 family glutaredoxin-like protein [Flavobacteriales bacterium]